MRLDRELKEAGDAALAELGPTPSTAVRALWEQAASRGKGMETIAPLLLGSANPVRLLVCADVWVALLGTDKNKQQAENLVAQARACGAELLYPATALKDVFTALVESEGLSGDEAAAWQAVDRMRELGTAVGVDEADLMLACRYRGLTSDLSGNIAFAAAERAKADYMVTFDDQLLRRSTVAALAPQDMCAVLKARASGMRA